MTRLFYSLVVFVFLTSQSSARKITAKTTTPKLEEANCVEEMVAVKDYISKFSDFECEFKGNPTCFTSWKCTEKIKFMNVARKGLLNYVSKDALPRTFDSLKNMATLVYKVWHSNSVVYDDDEKKWVECKNTEKMMFADLYFRFFKPQKKKNSNPYALAQGAGIMRNLFNCVVDKMEQTNEVQRFFADREGGDSVVFLHPDTYHDSRYSSEKDELLTTLSNFYGSDPKEIRLEEGHTVFTPATFQLAVAETKMAFFLAHGNQDSGYGKTNGGVFFGGKVPGLRSLTAGKKFDPAMGSARESMGFISKDTVPDQEYRPTQLMFIGACLTGKHSKLAEAFMDVEDGVSQGTRFVIAFKGLTAINARSIYAANFFMTKLAQAGNTEDNIPLAFKHMLKYCYLSSVESEIEECIPRSDSREAIADFNSHPILFYGANDVSTELQGLVQAYGAHTKSIS